MWPHTCTFMYIEEQRVLTNDPCNFKHSLEKDTLKNQATGMKNSKNLLYPTLVEQSSVHIEVLIRHTVSRHDELLQWHSLLFPLGRVHSAKNDKVLWHEFCIQMMDPAFVNQTCQKCVLLISQHCICVNVNRHIIFSLNVDNNNLHRVIGVISTQVTTCPHQNRIISLKL
jgi:hypothetical protein